MTEEEQWEMKQLRRQNAEMSEFLRYLKASSTGYTLWEEILDLLQKKHGSQRVSKMKAHVPSVIEDYVLLCEFPTHIIETYTQDIDHLKRLIECHMNNSIYSRVKLYEIRNKENETVYRKEVKSYNPISIELKEESKDNE